MKRLLGGVVAVLLALGCYVMLHFGFDRPDAAEGRGTGRTQFAEDRAPDNAPRPLAQPVAFDGKRAMGYLEAVCAIGPRMSGTKGMRQQQDLPRKHLEN